MSPQTYYGDETIKTYTIRFDADGRLSNAMGKATIADLLGINVTGEDYENGFKEILKEKRWADLLGTDNIETLVSGLEEFLQEPEEKKEIKYHCNVEVGDKERHLMLIAKKDLIGNGWQLVINDDTAYHDIIEDMNKTIISHRKALNEMISAFETLYVSAIEIRHDMRNPISNIGLYASAFKKKDNASQDEIKMIIDDATLLLDQLDKIKESFGNYHKQNEKIRREEFHRTRVNRVVRPTSIIRETKNEHIKTYTLRFDQESKLSNAMAYSSMAEELGILAGKTDIGKSIEEILSRKKWKNLLNEEDLEALKRDYARLLRGEIDKSKHNFTVYVDGKEKHLFFLGKKDLKNGGWQLVINEDIRLHEAIRKKEDTIKEYNSVIEERNNALKRIAEFEAEIRSQTRDPIERIRRNANTLIERTPENVVYIQNILGEVQYLSDLCDGLRQYSEKQNNRIELFDAEKELSEYITSKRYKIKGTEQIRLNYTTDGQAKEIEMDKACFRRVIDNIFNNAIQKIEGKEEKQKYEINARFYVEDDYAVLEISDNAGKINAENLEQIFEPLYTTKKKTGGTGMGLANSYKIMTEIGGKITAETDNENTATFKIHIPLYQNEEKQT